jgi:hypothetical protein
MDDLNRAGEHGDRVSDPERFAAQEKAIAEIEKLGFKSETGATANELQQLACMAANFTTANESLFNVMKEKMPSKNR